MSPQTWITLSPHDRDEVYDEVKARDSYCVDCGDADAENGLCLECREVEYDRDERDDR